MKYSESLTETLLLKESEETWFILQISQQPLQMHSGKHSDKLHYSVVWELHHSVQEGSPAFHQIGTARLWSSLPTATGHLQHLGHKEGTQQHQGLLPSTAQAVHTPARRHHTCVKARTNRLKNCFYPQATH